MTFKPEFLNRIDDIVTFRALTLEDIDRIVDIQLSLVQKRLHEQKMSLELTEEAKKYIAAAGYSPVYGARPLKRALQKLILDELALKILEGSFSEGDRLTVDTGSGEELVFRKGS